MQVGSSSISANSSQRLACGPQMEPLASIPARALTARGWPVPETSRQQGAPPLEHEVAADEYADFTKRGHDLAVSCRSFGHAKGTGVGPGERAMCALFIHGSIWARGLIGSA
jgi:hypothetical protein